ncbi:acyl-CoA dehydrogenase family protein [Streptomyces tendae]
MAIPSIPEPSAAATEPATGPALAVMESNELLTPVAREIRDGITELIPLLREEAARAEGLDMITPRALEALNDAGAFRIAHPVEYGGYALGARDIAAIVSETARGDGSAAWTVWAGTGVRLLLGFPQQAVDELFEDAKDWVGPLTCNASILSVHGGRARRTEEGWLVKGDWRFASGCGHAAWAMVGVQHEGSDGEPVRAMALIPRDQYRVLDDWKVMGLRGSNSNGISVEQEVFVPEHRYGTFADFPRRMAELPERYSGIGLKTGPNASQVVVALNVAPIALGMARATLECFIEQAKKRAPFSLAYRSVAEMPSTHIVAATAEVMINAAQALIDRHADTLDRCAEQGVDITPEVSSAITMDIVYAVRQCADAIDKLQMALGSSTVSLSNPIQRFARDARVMATHRMFRLEEMAEMRGRTLLGVEQAGIPHQPNQHRKPMARSER